MSHGEAVHTVKNNGLVVLCDDQQIEPHDRINSINVSSTKKVPYGLFIVIVDGRQWNVINLSTCHVTG